METALFVTGSLSVLIWLYLILLQGGFWRADQQLDYNGPDPKQWPAVAILMVTADDAEAIEETLPGLLDQAYPGDFHVTIVDDNSRDGTRKTAMRVAKAAGHAERLSVLALEAPPAGWSRRTWALARAQEHATRQLPAVRYLLLTEPWVRHERHNVQDLAAKAEGERCGLVSLLPLSGCETHPDRLLSPAFAFFFQAFHPLRWINDPQHAAAAASPGCVLVNINALKAVGGFAALKDAAVVEGVLAAKVKAAARRHGSGIWLGLGEDSTSVRFGDHWMALRAITLSSAEAQLRASPTRLATGVIAMILACLVPPIVLMWALVAGFFLDIDQFLVTFLAILLTSAAWAGMSYAAWPTFEVYGQEQWRTLLLPLAALAHLLFTMVSLSRLIGTVRLHGNRPGAISKRTTQASAGAVRMEPRLDGASRVSQEPTTGRARRRLFT